jgi:hypothetical protein
VHEKIVITYVPPPFTRKEKYSSKEMTIHGQKEALHIVQYSTIYYALLLFE